MNLKKLLIIATIFTLSHPCWANNALRAKAFRADPTVKNRKEFKIDKRMVIRQEPLLTHEDVAEIVPTDFQENESSQSVVGRILQNTANKIMQSDIIANSFLMKTAKQVESSTKVDIAIKQENDVNPSDEIEHKVNFDVQALKGLAKITYSGLIDSKIEYQASNNTFQVSLEEKLSGNSKMVLSHLNDRQQSRQLLQYQVSW